MVGSTADSPSPKIGNKPILQSSPEKHRMFRQSAKPPKSNLVS